MNILKLLTIKRNYEFSCVYDAWRRQPLCSMVINLLLSDNFKGINKELQLDICFSLKKMADVNDDVYKYRVLRNIRAFIDEREICQSKYSRDYYRILDYNKTFDVVEAYRKIKNEEKLKGKGMLEALKFLANGLGINFYYQAKKLNRMFPNFINNPKYYQTATFLKLSSAIKNTVYNKINLICDDKDISRDKKEDIFDCYYEFFRNFTFKLNEEAMARIIEIFLDNPYIGKDICEIFLLLQDKESINNIIMYIKMYSELNARWEIKLKSIQSILEEDELRKSGKLVDILNNIINTKLDKQLVCSAISLVLKTYPYSVASKLIDLLFAMKSDKHIHLAYNLLKSPDSFPDNSLFDIMSTILNAADNEIEQLGKNIMYKLDYNEMLFKDAVIFHNTEAMKILDNNSGIKSNTLVRIPIYKKRQKYRI